MNKEKLKLKIKNFFNFWIVVYRNYYQVRIIVSCSGKFNQRGWKSRLCYKFQTVRYFFNESACLGLQAKVGGKILLKLNINQTPIANKYCEGKMKRILKRKSKVPEIVKREDIELCVDLTLIYLLLIKF